MFFINIFLIFTPSSSESVCSARTHTCLCVVFLIACQISVSYCLAQLAALTLQGLRVQFSLSQEMYVLVLLYNAMGKSVKFNFICIFIYYVLLNSSTLHLSVICAV
jgi:hypothetical protein